MYDELTITQMEFIMKMLIILASIIALTACSSSPKNPETALHRVMQTTKATDAIVSKLRETRGLLEIEFDDNGEWLALAAAGTEPIIGNDETTAYLIAEQRAKGNIAQFLNSNVRTSRSSSMTSRSAVDHSVDLENDSDKKAATAARKAAERITESASAVMKGVRVHSRETDGDTVTVYVVVTAVSISGSRNISKKISGMMQ